MLDASVRAALAFISPEERGVWIQVGMALHSEYGSEAYPDWRDWSAQSRKFNESDARSAWRSFKVGGGITMGTLWELAQQGGYVPRGGESRLTPEEIADREIERAARRQQLEREAEAARQRAVRAAAEAQQMLERAGAPEVGHPYLVRKGLPEVSAHILDGKLLLPMRNVWNGQVQAVQTIEEDGRKKFQPWGCSVKESVFHAGGYRRNAEGVSAIWICEGYASALSVYLALQRMYRIPPPGVRGKRDKVLVAYSAHAIKSESIRRWIAREGVPGYVIADNDASRTGQKVALETEYDYWMPPEVGMDANDCHVQWGLDWLADALGDFLFWR